MSKSNSGPYWESSGENLSPKVSKSLLDSPDSTNDFTRFIEQNGIPKILIEAICALNELPEKPDNPVDWLQSYFRQDAPQRHDEIEKEMSVLRQEVIEKASKLSVLRMEENRKIKILRNLKEPKDIVGDATSMDSFTTKKTFQDDKLWSVQPDPFFRVTNSTHRIYKSHTTLPTTISHQLELIKSISQPKIGEDTASENPKKSIEGEPFQEMSILNQVNNNIVDVNHHTSHRTVILEVKDLHSNSAVESSNSDENLKADPSQFNKKTLSALAAIREDEVEADAADQNSAKKIGSGRIKKKKLKGKSEVVRKMSSKKSARQNEKLEGNIEEETQAEEFVEDIQMGNKGNINVAPSFVKKRGLPIGDGEEYMENIPENYWTTDLRFRDTLINSDESSSDDDCVSFRI